MLISTPSQEDEILLPAVAKSSSSNLEAVTGLITSSSTTMNLDSLATVATQLPRLGHSDTVSITQDERPGYFQVSVISPSK